MTDRVCSCRLISHYGISVITAVNSNDIPLLCDAIVQQQLDSAGLLLDYARDRSRFVEINKGSCPTLDWAIQKGSVDVAAFVMDYLIEKRLSVDESCVILTNYLIPLVKKFPNLMADYLESDKFAFEYGRFSVPYTLFEKNGRRPIAMTTNEALDDWTMPNSAATKDFWMRNSEEYAAEMAKTSDFQVDVIAKFFCVDQHFVRKKACSNTVGIRSTPHTTLGWNHVLRMLSTSNLRLDVFNSESVKAFTNWMFYSLCGRFLFLLIVDVLAAGFFSFFAASYGLRREEPSGLDERLLRFSILLSFALPLATLPIRDSMIKCVNAVDKDRRQRGT